MIKISFANGWSYAPHCWKSYILRPVVIKKNKVFTSISIIGFVFWVY